MAPTKTYEVLSASGSVPDTVSSCRAKGVTAKPAVQNKPTSNQQPIVNLAGNANTMFNAIGLILLGFISFLLFFAVE